MPTEFERVFRAHYPAVHRFVHRRLGRDLADELAAETFAIAYASWQRFDASRPARPWLYGIATNLLRHHYRAEERKLRAYARTGVDPIEEPITDDATRRLDARAQARAVAGLLADMRPGEREILLLHAWADLSDEEISLALDLPLGTVKSRLSRSRERLRNHLRSIEQQQSESAEGTKELRT